MISNIKNKLILALLIFATALPVMAKTKTVTLTERNTVVFQGGVNLNDMDILVRAITATRIVLPQDEQVYVVIASPGGYYGVAKMVSMALDQFQNISLVCRVCASAAGLIFMTSRHPRLVSDTSEVMMHEMYNPHATAAFMENATLVSDFIQSSKEFDETISSTLKMKLEDYQKRVRNTSWTLKGKDIVKKNAASALVKIECSPYVQILAPVTCGVKDVQSEE